ncbi:MAG: M48 family metalloprotease [Pseudomonadota bacterium]
MKRFLKALTIVALATGAVSACAPTAKNTQQSLAQEQATARKVVADMDRKGALLKDKNLNNYVGSIVSRVAKQRPAGSVPLRTYLVKDADVNAFTVGGGYVFFNAGMIAAMENEAQLASVAAHEIAHIDRGHVQAGQANRTGVQLGAALASVAGAALGVPGQLTNMAVGLGANYAVNSFTRTQETDADNTGVQYLAGAGYNVLEGAKSFAVLRRLYGDSKGASAAFFSSHPPSSEREANLTAQAKRLGATKGRVAADTYNKQTRGLRKEALKFYEAKGRSAEAAQIRRNLR